MNLIEKTGEILSVNIIEKFNNYINNYLINCEIHCISIFGISILFYLIVAKKIIVGLLENIKIGYLEIVDRSNKYEFGSKNIKDFKNVYIKVKTDKFWVRLLLNKDLVY